MIEVLKPGLSTSIQDRGRVGFGKFGIPQSGAMDTYSAKFANLLVGNSVEDAVLEITQLGPTLYFHCNSLVAIAGLGAEVWVNQTKVPVNEAFLIRSTEVLEIKRSIGGNFVYMAVAGGFLTPQALESRSMYDGVTLQNKIKKGDFLEITAFSREETSRSASVYFDESPYFSNKTEVFPGPEFHLLSSNVRQTLLQNRFTISSDSSRMAYLMEENLKNDLDPILTGPVLPGTVQLTPGGKLIVLMRDAQVTGGYPRVLQITERDFHIFAQKRAGAQFEFHLIKTVS